MYSTNDYVVYGSTGVCKVVEISQASFGGKKSREYYVLSPVFGNQVDIFIPTDKQETALRPVLSKDEVMRLIDAMPGMESAWIADDSFRKATFSEIIQSGDQERIIRLIKMIFNRTIVLEKSGRKLGNTDTEVLKQAEKILNQEFAIALDLQPEQVSPLIKEQI
ncbi:MAG: CarD family transcriptional regulator [Eubacteriales bacterium]|nr:CarD family transcriptional regulator [Eubacteriales bacterium]